MADSIWNWGNEPAPPSITDPTTGITYYPGGGNNGQNPYADQPWSDEYRNWNNLNGNQGTFDPYNIPGTTQGIENWTIPQTNQNTWNTKNQPQYFAIPKEFAQADPVTQKALGSVGGKLSGPANPYNNGQFVNTPQNPIESLISGWQNVFGEIGKNSFLSPLLGTTKGIGVGVGPIKSTANVLSDNQTPTLKPQGPIVSQFDLPPSRIGQPKPGTQTFEVTGMQEMRNEVPALADVITKAAAGGNWVDAATIEKTAPSLLKFYDTNPLGFKSLVDSTDDTKAMDMVYAVTVTGKNVLKNDQGQPLVDDEGKEYTGVTGIPIRNPVISDERFSALKDPVAMNFFWNNFPDMLPAEAWFSKLAPDVQAIIRDVGVPLSFAYFGFEAVNTKEINPAELYNYAFYNRLVEEGYQPAVAKNIVLNAIKNYENGQQNIPTITVNVPNIIRTMPFDKAMMLASSIHNIAQATVPAGVVGKLGIPGHDFERGQAIIELEKMRNGDVELVPGKDNHGNFTGYFATKQRTYGYNEQLTGNGSKGALSGVPNQGSLTLTEYQSLIKMWDQWKGSGSTLSFEEWLKTLKTSAPASTSTTSSTRTRRPRLRSVSY